MLHCVHDTNTHTHTHNHICSQFLFAIVYLIFFTSLAFLLFLMYIDVHFHSEISYNYALCVVLWPVYLFIWLCYSSFYLLVWDTGFYLTFRRTKCFFFWRTFVYRSSFLHFWLLCAAFLLFPLSVWFLIYISFNLHVFCSMISCLKIKRKCYHTIRTITMTIIK